MFNNEELREHFQHAIWRAVEIGWLSPVDHGFCFDCLRETAVFEVIATEAPPQPPRCMDCFVSVSAKALETIVWSDFVEGH